MVYKNMYAAKFLKRPNRFIAHCELDGEIVAAHVRNTGRLKELLVPGAKVFLQKSDNSSRKTGYSLISVCKGEELVNIDSTAPNRVVFEALKEGRLLLPGLPDLTLVKQEAKFGESRFDFYLEAGDKKAFVEVKGVTLELDNVALFPDAPTERGTRHVEELIKAKEEGFEAYLLFILQMRGKFFSPHTKMHPRFAEAVKKASEKGVHVLAYDCLVDKESLTVHNSVEVVI